MLIDLLYITGTLAFFAAMLAYVRGCERLGRGSRPGTVLMGAESLVGGLIALAILVYLLYTLLHPEKF